MQASDSNAGSVAPLSVARGSIRKNNIVAFEDVYKANSKLVRRLCLRMLRDPIEAEDAAQDVFLRVLLKLHTFRGESALSSWLYRLTTNIVLMRFRKNNQEQPSRRMFLDDDSEPGSQISKPDLYLSAAADRVDLQAAIDLLPGGTRAVFVLHEIQGYAHKEIAERFGYSIGNSKSQLYKARRRLRKLLINNPQKPLLRPAKLKPSSQAASVGAAGAEAPER
jgi:RNA polymerase sigma-70 factor (ECF subfamily)